MAIKRAPTSPAVAAPAASAPAPHLADGLEVRRVIRRGDLPRFIRTPWSLYSGRLLWVPLKPYRVFDKPAAT